MLLTSAQHRLLLGMTSSYHSQLGRDLEQILYVDIDKTMTEMKVIHLGEIVPSRIVYN